MSIPIKKEMTLAGRPLFRESNAVSLEKKGSLFKENSLLNRLRPSHNSSTFLLMLNKILKIILNFFRVIHPDPLAQKKIYMMRPGGVKAVFPLPLSLEDFTSHFQEFLKKERGISPSLRKIFSKMEGDEARLQKLLSQKPLDESALKSAQGKKFEQAKKGFSAQLTKELKEIPLGTHRLFLIQRGENPLYGIFSHTPSGIQLSFTGSPASMSELQGEGGYPLAGKEKVLRHLIFKEIPLAIWKNGKFAEEFVDLWANSEGEKGKALREKLSLFAPYQKKALSIRNFDQISARSDKVFWNVISLFSTSSEEKSELKQIKLRADLFTLFKAFQEARGDLKSGSEEYYSLKSMLARASENALLAYEKKEISKEVLDEVYLELQVIDKALKEVNRSQKEHISSKISSKPFILKEFDQKHLGLKIAQEAAHTGEVSPLKDPSKGRPPHAAPMDLSEINSISLQREESAKSIDQLKEKLCFLHEKAQKCADGEKPALAREISDFFTRVPSALFWEKKDGKEETNPNSLWGQMGREEVRRIIGMMNDLAEFSLTSMPPGSLSRSGFHAFLKMGHMAQFLTAIESGYWISSFDFIPFINPWEGRLEAFTDWQEGSKWEGRIDSFKKPARSSYESKRHKGVWEGRQFYEDEAGKPVPLSQESKKWIGRMRVLIDYSFGLIETLPKEPKWDQRGIEISFSDKTASRLEKDIIKKAEERWIRPIKDPFLTALYRQVQFKIPLEIEKRESRPGQKVPEAFHADPEGMFHFFFEKMKSGEEGSVEPFLDFTEEEMKRLSRLLERDEAEVELLAFMRESPSLMRRKEVRNFFDALLFHRRYLIFSTGETDPLCLSFFNEEISRLEEQIKKDLQTATLKDIDLTKSRCELLFFYGGIFLKKRDQSKEKVPLEGVQEKLSGILGSIQKREELADIYPYGVQISLYSLLNGENLPSERMEEIFYLFATLRSGTIDLMDSDPMIEEKIDHCWKKIAEELKKAPAHVLEGAHLHPLLDFFCAKKDLFLDESSWKHIGDLVYQNALYQVDLKNWKISLLGEKSSLDQLPPPVIANSSLQRVFGKNFLANVKVRKEERKNCTLYTFNDEKGHPFQIEENPRETRLYRKIGEKWLQYISPALFSKASLEKLEGKRKASEGLIKKIFSALKGVMKKTASQMLPFIGNGLYIDPKNPTRGTVLNGKGEVDFEITLKYSKEGVSFEEVKDFREGKTTLWKVATLASIKKKGLECLEAFENKEEILLFSQKSRLKKVELPRYGLTFTLDKGRLKCELPPYRGYLVKANASLQEKKGLTHALFLEHPDPKKEKKLLLPEASALKMEQELLPPRAYGFGKIALLFHYLRLMFNLLRGKMGTVSLKVRYAFDPEKRKIGFTAYTIRPYTGEICQKKKGGAKEFLELARHALFSQQGALAASILGRIKWDLNQSFLNEMVSFLKGVEMGSGEEEALKFKTALKLISLLKKEKKLKSSMKEILYSIALEKGKATLAHGRKLPEPLQLGEEDRLELAKISKRIDPTYYKKHLEIYFQKEGTLEDFSPQETGKRGDIDLAPLLKKRKEALPLDEKSIEALEKTLKVKESLPLEKLSYSIPKAVTPEPLLFKKEELGSLFEEKAQLLKRLKPSPREKSLEPCEKKALQELEEHLEKYRKGEEKRPHYSLKASKKTFNQFIRGKLIPKKVKALKDLEEGEKEIEALLRGESVEETLSIFSRRKLAPTLEELRVAFSNNTLEGLVGKSAPLYREKLSHYFDALSRKNCIEAAIQLAEEVLQCPQEEIDAKSNALFRLLTTQRHYDKEKDPRLLIFEAQTFINFRPLEGGLDQLELLNALVEDPKMLLQAPTGAGKTSVFSVMRSLLKANGENLVVQKVLPHLFQQTYDQFTDTLGGLFGKNIYPLLFNLKMPLTKKENYREKNAQGIFEEKQREVSIFKRMYLNLLEVVKNKGAVLTDYKSLPLLEESFFKLGQELLEKQVQGIPYSTLQREHYEYLRKILLLVGKRGDVNMDEFDEATRPTQKVQIDLAAGAKPLPEFLLNGSLDIYELLDQDPALSLSKNIQGDLSKKTREGCIIRSAKKMALTFEGIDQEKLLAYFLGENEEILPTLEGLDPHTRDRAALCKDQFSLFLPLTLKENRTSRYDRSEDGRKTVVCHSGSKRDAKFGTNLEQVNYTIQDYLQGGITSFDLKPWFKELRDRWSDKDPEQQKILEQQLRDRVGNRSFASCGELLKTEEGTEKLVKEINRNKKVVKAFLKERLQRLRTSGALISMNPQDITEMELVTSGVSATTGAPESLHNKFHVDRERNGEIQANMVYRIERRAAQNEAIPYNPEHPEELFTKVKAPLHAVIDGAGAFKCKPKEAAEGLKKSNGKLIQVGYHEEGEIQFVGKMTGELSKTGFFFDLSRTRGTDITLDPKAKALLTLKEEGFRDFAQKEGRLRGGLQRYYFATPEDQGVTSIEEKIGEAVCIDSKTDAKDIYRKCKQEAKAHLRSAAKRQLLGCETVEEFVELFKVPKRRKLIITDPEKAFENPGEYFEMRKHIQKEDQKPKDVLNALKEQGINETELLDLKEAKERIEAITYSEELLEKMPSFVSGIGKGEFELEMEVQVEQEEEQEEEEELEIALEAEEMKGRRTAGEYPARLHSSLRHSLAEKIHKAYNPCLFVSDAFLPLSRQGTASLHKRAAFDSSSYRVGRIILDFTSETSWGTTSWKIRHATIEDPLIDYKMYGNFIYDIRTEKIIKNSLTDYDRALGDFKAIPPETILQMPSFQSVIAQAKYFDGRSSTYSEGELQELKKWLIQEGPHEMREHFLNDILRFRYAEKQAFPGSQLDLLFKELA